MALLAKADQKPHAVCIPFPTQGHINPLLKLSKLLHHSNFHITFVNTENNHRRLLKSRGSNSLAGLPDFCFETIPDGLPPITTDSTQHIPSLCDSTRKNCLVPFRNLLVKLNDSSSLSNVPPVTCIISDGIMSFTLKVSEELGIPNVLFWTTSACAFMGYNQCIHLMARGITPFKDASYLTNGYIDTKADWIPGMKNMRLRDIPSFIRTTDPNDIMLDFLKGEIEGSKKASAIILHTFDALEHHVLSSLSSMFPPIFTIGPLQLLLNQIPNKNLTSMECSLWKQEAECIQWLNSKEPNSVLYVNFGSIMVLTQNQLVELAWGLADSKQNFLWIIRPDLVMGDSDSAILPPEFIDETQERGFMVSWCRQEEVLSHPSVAGFLTHNGWNSTIESISSGVPMLCFPFLADQQTNCRYASTEWGIGMEIDDNVKRDTVEKLVRELMEGEKGEQMKNKAMEWKIKAEEATSPCGSSYLNLQRLLKEILLSKNYLQ